MSMRKIALFLALTIALSQAIPAMAETASVAARPFDVTVVRVEGGETQAELEAHTKTLIEADGLKFKDLNANGALDVYEDWRRPTDERVADLISQMTIEEKVGVLLQTAPYQLASDDNTLYSTQVPMTGVDSSAFYSVYSVWHIINEFHVTTFLDNANGTPDVLAENHNKMQEIAEQTRLGIPLVFTVDREYNAWGGYVDFPHDAVATAHNVELASALMARYAQEMRATGFHVILHPFGVELGSWYGEDPAYLAEMVAAEVKAYQENGIATTAKHFVARGGDASFASARSEAQTVENWMVPWQAAIDAGTKWVMTTTSGAALTNTVRTDYDQTTMRYLRDTLGIKGIVITDVGPVGSPVGTSGLLSGVTAEGVDLSQVSNAELYAMMLKNGVDLFEGQVSTHEIPMSYCNYPEDMIDAVELGYCEMEDMDRALTNVLTFKFDEGLFENPYVDPQAAVALCANEAYAAEPWEIVDNETFNSARPAELVAMEKQLQAESAVLVKNDGALLPLKAEQKVYVQSINAANGEKYAQAIGAYAQVVEEIKEADVAVLDATSINDNTTLMVEDAQEAGKPIVLVLNNTDPTAWALENADAVLFMNFSRTIDHGASGSDGIVSTTEPDVYAALLFGEAEPNGMIVKEIARDAAMDNMQWKDLAGDQGASDKIRLILLALMREHPDVAVPANYGDPLLTYEFGMHYGQETAFSYDTLVVPHTLTETTNAYGRTVVSRVVAPVKSGEPFTVSCLLWNHGDDGVVNVQAKDGETVVAEKLMAVNDHSWRVVEMEVTLEGAGEHTLTVGDLSAVITVE